MTLLLTVLASLRLLSLDYAPQESVVTQFRPSLDLPSIQNPSVTYALFGACVGADDLAHVFYDLRVNHNGPPLHNITKLITQQRPEAYLKHVLGIAHKHSEQLGEPIFAPRLSQTQPNQFIESIVAGLRQGNPISVTFGNATVAKGVSLESIGMSNVRHRVTIYGADKVNGTWILRVADTNAPPGLVDDVRLQYDPAQKSFVEETNGRISGSWSQGDAIRTPVRDAQDYKTIITLAVQGKSYDEILSQSHTNPIDNLNDSHKSASIQRGPGGVLIKFDPSQFGNGIEESKLVAMQTRITEFLATNTQGALVIRPQPLAREICLVPLQDIRAHGTLGGLTRVLGFVRASNGSISLAGLREAGHESIPADILVVAMQSIYQRGSSPYISLDPDMRFFSELAQLSAGLVVPQITRVGGLDSSLQNSLFIKQMLEADYLMKRITLGAESPSIPGFRRWFDVLKTAPPGQYANRQWLSPLASPAGDVYIHRAGNAIAMLFESMVGVQAESQRLAHGGFEDAGSDPYSKESARQFTTHYAELAAVYPEFYRLYGVFDACKVCAAWRSLGIEASTLPGWLTVKPLQVSIPKSYVGLGPFSLGTGRGSVSGGAIADATVLWSSPVETSRLAPMLSGTGVRTAKVELPSVLPVAASSLAAFEAQSLMRSADEAYVEGRLPEALDSVDVVLELVPVYPKARLLRAQILAGLSRFPEALSDLGRILVDSRQASLRLLAEARIMRVQLNGISSEQPVDTSELRSLCREFGDDDILLMESISAFVCAQDYDGAIRALYQLADLSPSCPLLPVLDREIFALRLMNPKDAHRRMVLYSTLPIPILKAYLEMIAGSDLQDTIHTLGEIESGRLATPEGAFVKEQLQFLIADRTIVDALKQRPADLALAGRLIDQLVSDHPTWRTGPFLRVMHQAAIHAGFDETIGAMRSLAAIPREASDPLFDGLVTSTFGSKYPVTLLSLLNWLDISNTQDHATQWLQLATERAPESSKPFLLALAAEREVNFARFFLEDGQQGFAGSTEARLAMLNRITAPAAAMRDDDPAFVIALVLAAGAISKDVPHNADYVAVCRRALALAKHSIVGSMKEYSLFRAVAWKDASEMLGEESRAEGPPRSAAERKVLSDYDAQFGDHPPGLSLDQLRTLVKARDGILVSDRQARLATQKSILGRTAGEFGAWTANILEFILTVAQPESNVSRFVLEPLATRTPALKTTREFLQLQEHLDHFAPLSTAVATQLWGKVIGGVHTTSDGVAVTNLIEILQRQANEYSAANRKILTGCQAAIAARNAMGYLQNARP